MYSERDIRWEWAAIHVKRSIIMPAVFLKVILREINFRVNITFPDETTIHYRGIALILWGDPWLFDRIIVFLPKTGL